MSGAEAWRCGGGYFGVWEGGEEGDGGWEGGFETAVMGGRELCTIFSSIEVVKSDLRAKAS